MNRDLNTPDPSPEQRKALALQRLASSRNALILSLSPKPPTPIKSPQPASANASSSLFSALALRVERNGLIAGGGRALRALARRWWTRQPWHSSVELVGSTLAHEMRPLIRRNPWTSLAVGAALGATVVLAKPLIWRPLNKQLHPWRNNLGGMVWSQLSQVPVQMALAGALAAWINEAGKKASSADAMATPAATPAAAPSTTPSSPGRY